MYKGFWEQLEKPIFALAPLHDVTDHVFRQMIARKGKPSVFFTEFTSTDGLCHEVSHEKMVDRYLRFTEDERPLVAQIWGTRPEYFRQTAELLVRLGFDGIDINMGCPEKSAVKHGACSALSETPELAQQIIRATQEGAAGKLPVSVKIRLGFKENMIEEWMQYLLECEPAVITVHGRIAKHMSRYPADWESIGRAVEIARGSDTIILGNGDVKTLEEGKEKVRDYGVDGVMYGRGIFGNHWLFSGRSIEEVSEEEKLQALVDHAKLYEKEYSGRPASQGASRGKPANASENASRGRRGFHVLRKHFKAYTLGIEGAKELRVALMKAENSGEVEQLVSNWKAGR